MSAGHAVPLVVFHTIQGVPDKIGQEASSQGNGLECGQRITGPNGRKENIPDEGNVIAKQEDKHRLVKIPFWIPEIHSQNENDWEEIIDPVKEGQEIGEPGGNPAFDPDRWMDAEQKEINPNQPGIDIRVEILNEISEGFVDQNNKKDGRKIIKEASDPSQARPLRGQLEGEEKAYPQAITKDQGTPEWNMALENEHQKDQTDQKKKGQPVDGSDSFHG